MMVKAKERSVSTALDLAGWMWKWFVFLYLIAQLLQKVFNSSSTRLPEITFISSCPALQRVIPPSSPSSPPLPSPQAAAISPATNGGRSETARSQAGGRGSVTP